MFLATHGWWPWLLLYAVCIGAIGALLIHLLRKHRAKNATTISATTDAAPVDPAAEASASSPPDQPT